MRLIAFTGWLSFACILTETLEGRSADQVVRFNCGTLMRIITSQ